MCTFSFFFFAIHAKVPVPVTTFDTAIRGHKQKNITEKTLIISILFTSLFLVTFQDFC